MSTQNSAQATLLGGWTAYHPLTAEDQKVWDEAMRGFVGVNYKPQTVSSQLVNGTNYRFKCTASIPPAEVMWDALVDIYAPINGMPYVTGITRV